MLATIISKYLQENRRLVIPQLGAFLVKEPGHVILFSQLLTKDDGVLQNLLIESGMSDLEASGTISRLLFDIRFVSENGGKYWLTGVGHFSMDQKGSLHFEFDPQTTPQATYSTDEVSEELQQDESQDEQSDEQSDEQKPNEEATVHEEQNSEPIEEKEEPTQERPAETPAETPEAPAQSVTEEIEEPQAGQDTPQDNTNNQTDTLAAAPEEYRHIHLEADPDLEGLSYGGNGKRSRRRASTPSSKKLDWWMIIAVTAALLAISVILYGFLREGAQHGSPIAARVEQVQAPSNKG